MHFAHSTFQADWLSSEHGLAIHRVSGLRNMLVEESMVPGPLVANKLVPWELSEQETMKVSASWQLLEDTAGHISRRLFPDGQISTFTYMSVQIFSEFIPPAVASCGQVHPLYVYHGSSQLCSAAHTMPGLPHYYSHSYAYSSYSHSYSSYSYFYSSSSFS